MKVLMVCVLALIAIGFAEDVKKDKRSANDIHIGYGNNGLEEEVVHDKALLAQYAEILTGVQVIEQPVIVPTAKTPIVSEAASIEHYEVPAHAVQFAQEALPFVQQAIQEAAPIEQQDIQYTQAALPIAAQQTSPVQQEAIQYVSQPPQAIQYASQTIEYASQSVQYAPQPIQYASQPVQYAQEQLQFAPQNVQYAAEAVAVQSPPAQTIERTIYKTTHIDRLVPQPYPVKVAVPKPYPVYFRQRTSSQTVHLTSNQARNNGASNSLSNFLGRSNSRSAHSSLLRSLFSRNASMNTRYPSATSPEELVAIGQSLGLIRDQPGFIVRRIKQIKKDI